MLTKILRESIRDLFDKDERDAYLTNKKKFQNEFINPDEEAKEKILGNFNDYFGTDFTDLDKVMKFVLDLEKTDINTAFRYLTYFRNLYKPLFWR